MEKKERSDRSLILLLVILILIVGSLLTNFLNELTGFFWLFFIPFGIIYFWIGWKLGEIF